VFRRLYELYPDVRENKEQILEYNVGVTTEFFKCERNVLLIQGIERMDGVIIREHGRRIAKRKYTISRVTTVGTILTRLV